MTSSHLQHPVNTLPWSSRRRMSGVAQAGLPSSVSLHRGFVVEFPRPLSDVGTQHGIAAETVSSGALDGQFCGDKSLGGYGSSVSIQNSSRPYFLLLQLPSTFHILSSPTPSPNRYCGAAHRRPKKDRSNGRWLTASRRDGVESAFQRQRAGRAALCWTHRTQAQFDRISGRNMRFPALR